VYAGRFCLVQAGFNVVWHLHIEAASNCLTLQVVSEFLHGRLVGEGNLLRHLDLLGYKLAYSQSPLMEFPFAISNLAVDLRDGLRLIKVAEVLTGGCLTGPCICQWPTGANDVSNCARKVSRSLTCCVHSAMALQL